MNPENETPPQTSDEGESTWSHDGQMETRPDGTQIWHGQGPPPGVREQMEKEANTPGPCMLEGCGKPLPGKGWCSLRHRDIYQRKQFPEGRMPSKSIPANIQVEIAKGHGYWYDKYQEYQAEVRKLIEGERRRQQLAAQKAKEEAAGVSVEPEPVPHPTAVTTESSDGPAQE